MLRNQQKNKQLLELLFSTQQQRWIQQYNTTLCNKNTNIFRQGKIMEKLIGHRVSGSKKHWFPSNIKSTHAAGSNIMFKESQFIKTPHRNGKNAIRRITVLNKLFMKHITDLMATGEISDTILGKGLQVSRVKVSQDFTYITVYWLSNCEESQDILLEHELQRCSGIIRHELSQLGLMGVVPRIKFVKDNYLTNINQVENLLSKIDFGTDEEKQQEELDFEYKDKADTIKENFYGYKAKSVTAFEQELNENNKILDNNLPEMRHDVLGLDHKGIMVRILSKMRKSKYAWDQHLQKTSTELKSLNSIENFTTIPSISYGQLTKTKEKMAKAAENSEKFDDFLAKRKQRRNTPERKKFRSSNQNIDVVNVMDENDYIELPMSKRLQEVFEAEDYLLDDTDDRMHK